MLVTESPDLAAPVVPDAGSVRFLLSGYWRRMLLLAVSSLAGGFVEAAFLVLLTRAALSVSDREDVVVAGPLGELSLGTAVIIGLVLVVTRVALAAFVGWAGSALAARVTEDLRNSVMEVFLDADWSTQQDSSSGQFQELLTSFTQRGSHLVSATTGVISSGFSLVAMVALAIGVNPLASALLVGVVAALALAMQPLRGAVRKEARKAADSSLTYASALNEMADLGLETQVFHVQDAIKDRVRKLVKWQAEVSERVNFLSSLVPTVYTGCAYGAVLGALAIVAQMDGADFRSVGAVMLVMVRSLTYGQGLQAQLAAYSASRPFLDQLTDRWVRYAAGAKKTGTAELSSVPSVELIDVDFSYVEGRPVLSAVNLSIARGETVGIVGPSGGGKTTLVQMLLGLRSPTRGEVLVAGNSIESWSPDDLARRITFVPQQPKLIRGSLEDNIRFYRERIDGEQVVSASVRAHLHADVEQWPEGYSRDVGERGSRLSGGQQQRVCIARALVENPDVIVLDEPTSALDAAAEEAIRDTLADLRGQCAVVIIAHRPATLSICDRVLVVDGGRLVERTIRTDFSAERDLFDDGDDA